MQLLMPNVGLFFWSLVIFGLLFLLLRWKAWPAILKALREREASIQRALDEAVKAREDMANLQAQIADTERAARQERDRILKEASLLRDQMVEQAKAKAHQEAAKIVEDARAQIESEKKTAIAELRVQAGLAAVEIAEVLLKQEMTNKTAQEAFAKRMAEEIKLN